MFEVELYILTRPFCIWRMNWTSSGINEKYRSRCIFAEPEDMSFYIVFTRMKLKGLYVHSKSWIFN